MPHPILLFVLPASDRTDRVSEPQERDSLSADSVDIQGTSNRYAFRTHLDYIPYQKRNPAAVPRPIRDDSF